MKRVLLFFLCLFSFVNAGDLENLASALSDMVVQEKSGESGSKKKKKKQTDYDLLALKKIFEENIKDENIRDNYWKAVSRYKNGELVEQLKQKKQADAASLMLKKVTLDRFNELVKWETENNEDGHIATFLRQLKKANEEKTAAVVGEIYFQGWEKDPTSDEEKEEESSDDDW